MYFLEFLLIKAYLCVVWVGGVVRVTRQRKRETWLKNDLFYL